MINWNRVEDKLPESEPSAVISYLVFDGLDYHFARYICDRWYLDEIYYDYEEYLENVKYWTKINDPEESKKWELDHVSIP